MYRIPKERRQAPPPGVSKERWQNRHPILRGTNFTVAARTNARARRLAIKECDRRRVPKSRTVLFGRDARGSDTLTIYVDA